MFRHIRNEIRDRTLALIFAMVLLSKTLKFYRGIHNPPNKLHMLDLSVFSKIVHCETF